MDSNVAIRVESNQQPPFVHGDERHGLGRSFNDALRLPRA